MSLPHPNTSSTNRTPFQMSAKEQSVWDGPLSVLAQRSGGDLRLLLYAFFSFLHRKTDFYMVPDTTTATATATGGGGGGSMGFREGNAEKLLLAAFRQFPLRRVKLPPPRSAASASSSSSSSASTNTDTSKKRTDTTTKTTNKDAKNQTTVIHTAPSKDDSEEQQQQSNSNKQHTNSSPSTKTTKSNATNTNVNSNDTIQYTEDGKQIPTVGNGGSSPTHKYQWTQTVHEISIALPLPPSTRAKDLLVRIKPSTLSVSFKDTSSQQQTTSAYTTSTSSSSSSSSSSSAIEKKPILLSGQLPEHIRPDESTWSIEETNILLLTLDKTTPTWWSNALTGHEEIDTSLIDSKRHISDYDNETQAMIRKILFDQRQERLGLPNSEQLMAKDSPLLKEEAEEVLRNEGEGKGGGGGGGNVQLLGTDRASMPKLPPGVEFIDKDTFSTG